MVVPGRGSSLVGDENLYFCGDMAIPAVISSTVHEPTIPITGKTLTET